MIQAKLLRNAWAALDAGESLVLACHGGPDGDTLGSALALAHVMRARGKDVVVVSEDGVPENYRFIPESDTIVTATDRRACDELSRADFDIGMLVDCEGIKRAGKAAEPIVSAKTTACIDHHVPDGEFGRIRIVDQSASSTAELVFDLFEANQVTIDQICATQLLTGLIADTGAFRFANTSPRTFHTAARLTDLGGDPSVIAREVYDTRPLRAVKLLGRTLSSVEIEANGLVVVGVVTRDDLDELQASDTDTDSIINYVRMVKGAKVPILFREIERESIRISLRSRDGVDVNQVARAFGGGGHVAAAGCTVDAPLEEAKRLVLSEVEKWMES